MLSIIILLKVANIICLEFYENNPTSVCTLYIFMFNLVKMSYRYTYFVVPTSIYFSSGDYAIYSKPTA